MIDNKSISKVLKLTAQLMELHEENPFKVKSFANAAFQVGKNPNPIAQLSIEELDKINGLGKTTSKAVHEFCRTGKYDYLQELLEKTPIGVVEILSIKGLGPAKVKHIWKELGIESPGELLYACNENRLKTLKGFGDKTQEEVRKAIEFMYSNSGKILYAQAEELAQVLLKEIVEKHNPSRIELTGAVRRKDLIISEIEMVYSGALIHQQIEAPVPVKLMHCEENTFVSSLFQTTAEPAFLENVEVDFTSNFSSEEEIFDRSKLPFVVAEMRHAEFKKSWLQDSTNIIEASHLRGVLHNHSTWSDGLHTIEQMAQQCMKEGYTYFGICDHSQSAVYANGLKDEQVIAQQKEIDALNAKYPDFKIFKGIESDILNDGSLDYSEEILKTFDFVVASVHSAMKMDEERATARLIKAVENPYTSILGHPTGRLLLSRPGYPINHKKVIDACAANGVSIELNANPYRLDIDWKWIPYCMEKGVKISINPDAHHIDGIAHMRYGVYAARKGGLTKDFTLNALNASELAVIFSREK